MFFGMYHKDLLVWLDGAVIGRWNHIQKKPNHLGTRMRFLEVIDVVAMTAG